MLNPRNKLFKCNSDSKIEDFILKTTDEEVMFCQSCKMPAEKCNGDCPDIRSFRRELKCKRRKSKC